MRRSKYVYRENQLGLLEDQTEDEDGSEADEQGDGEVEHQQHGAGGHGRAGRAEDAQGSSEGDDEDHAHAVDDEAHHRIARPAGDDDPWQRGIGQASASVADLVAIDRWQRHRMHGDRAYRDMAGVGGACPGTDGCVGCCCACC